MKFVTLAAVVAAFTLTTVSFAGESCCAGAAAAAKKSLVKAAGCDKDKSTTQTVAVKAPAKTTVASAEKK